VESKIGKKEEFINPHWNVTPRRKVAKPGKQEVGIKIIKKTSAPFFAAFASLREMYMCCNSYPKSVLSVRPMALHTRLFSILLLWRFSCTLVLREIVTDLFVLSVS